MKTNREYIKSLKNDLFDATLMGLMGIELASPQEDALTKWLDSPVDPRFLGQEEVKEDLFSRLKDVCELGESRQQINLV
ncbi:MAG: hypothetical protein PHR82_09370 [Endomicrobiaceae bacterium]|nr:hypothetical protein [Endomicrobiaceae bacterium]